MNVCAWWRRGRVSERLNGALKKNLLFACWPFRRAGQTVVGREETIKKKTRMFFTRL